MAAADIFRLLLLSIIWGASFLLMRISAPEFGPVPLILVRTSIAAICFAAVFRLTRNRAMFCENLGAFFILGVFNTSLPFSLLAYSTLSLEAGFTSLLNATTPLFAAVIGAACFATTLRRPQVLGLFIAFCGVAILSWDRLSFKPGGSGLAVLAALAASLSYGISVNFAKHRLADIPPQVVSAGTLVMSSLILLIPGILLWPNDPPSTRATISALLLAVVCTAITFALFFSLLKRCGAMAASSVTFLIPVSAILWGVTVLGERVEPQLLVGMLVTLGGTALAVGLVARSKPNQKLTALKR